MPTRRQVIVGASALGGLVLVPGAARATPEMRAAAIREITGGAPVRDGRVTLTIPSVAENGLSVYTTVEVESPMTQADHVRAIHILAEKNPIARLVTWHLGPRAGVAKVATNIRLANTQEIVALAQLSDGSFWADRKNVIVTIAACIDGG